MLFDYDIDRSTLSHNVHDDQSVIAVMSVVFNIATIYDRGYDLFFNNTVFHTSYDTHVKLKLGVYNPRI